MEEGKQRETAQGNLQCPRSCSVRNTAKQENKQENKSHPCPRTHRAHSSNVIHHCLPTLLQQQPRNEFLSAVRGTGRTKSLLAYLHHHTVVELEEARRVVIDIRHMDMHRDITELSRVAVVCGSNCQRVTGDLEDL